MPLHWDKHAESGSLDLGVFSGGMNVSAPPHTIPDEDCAWIENMFFDGATGKLRSRFPILKYSNSAPNGTAANQFVTGLFYWNGIWFMTVLYGGAQTMYYLDANGDPQSLGETNGGNPPTFCPFHGELLIATGGVIQYTTSATPPASLANVSGSVSASYIFEKDNRVVAAGDPDYPDRVWQSSLRDETSWPTGTDDYADVGYQDGNSVIGIREFAEGLFLVFKRGVSGISTYFLTTLSNDVPSCKRVSSTHCPMSHRGVADAAGRVYMQEQWYVSSIVGTDVQGKILVDVGPGIKLSSAFKATSLGHAVVYPPDFQIWFTPDPTLNKTFVCHFNRQNAWTVFSWGSRRVRSAFFRPDQGFLYLGCDDGFIYKYDRLATAHEDTGGSYIQTVKSKVFDPFPRREKVVKSPMLFYQVLDGGNFKFSVWDSYGYSELYSETRTMASSGGVRVYETQSITVYSTQEGGANEMFLYTEIAMVDTKFDVNIPCENFQIRLDVTSGAMMLESIVADVALSIRKH